MSKSYLGRAVIECGRGAHEAYGDKDRYRNRVDADGEPFPPQKKHQRELRDNLRPLERWLKSNVNRPWSKVYSEFCAREDKRSLRGDHIHRHLKEMVRNSGGQESDFLYQPSYQEPCWEFHGYWSFWVDLRGFLRHHSRLDCHRYGLKVGWVKGAFSRVYRPYVPKPVKSGDKLDRWSFQRVLAAMNERDEKHPGWWLCVVRTVEVLSGRGRVSNG